MAFDFALHDMFVSVPIELRLVDDPRDDGAVQSSMKYIPIENHLKSTFRNDSRKRMETPISRSIIRENHR